MGHSPFARALVIAARHPEAKYAMVEMETHWTSVRSVVFPPEKLDALWLVDPHRCKW